MPAGQRREPPDNQGRPVEVRELTRQVPSRRASGGPDRYEWRSAVGETDMDRRAMQQVRRGDVPVTVAAQTPTVSVRSVRSVLRSGSCLRYGGWRAGGPARCWSVLGRGDLVVGVGPGRRRVPPRSSPTSTRHESDDGRVAVADLARGDLESLGADRPFVLLRGPRRRDRLRDPVGRAGHEHPRLADVLPLRSRGWSAVHALGPVPGAVFPPLTGDR